MKKIIVFAILLLMALPVFAETQKATLINYLGTKVVVEVGSQLAQTLFGNGYVLMGKDIPSSFGARQSTYINTIQPSVFSFSSTGIGIGTSTPYSKFQVTSGGSGASTTATTTVTIGEIGTTTSATCLNLKTNLGALVNAIIVGTSWVIGTGACK